jgi:hypothetical protein
MDSGGRNTLMKCPKCGKPMNRIEKGALIFDRERFDKFVCGCGWEMLKFAGMVKKAG